ncbi:MAG: hypothetical protein AMXMBFR76_22800 [Pseudomonadota bacterium]
MDGGGLVQMVVHAGHEVLAFAQADQGAGKLLVERHGRGAAAANGPLLPADVQIERVLRRAGSGRAQSGGL